MPLSVTGAITRGARRSPSRAVCLVDPAVRSSRVMRFPRMPSQPIRRAPLLCLLAIVASLAPPRGARADDELLLDAMKQELDRSKTELSLEHYQRPYFISYMLEDEEVRRMGAVSGAINERSTSHRRRLYVEVRVGMPHLDNTMIDPPDMDLESESSDVYGFRQAPLDDDPDALRTALWRLTDAAYKDALAGLAAKQGKRVFEVDPHEDVDDFAGRDRVEATEPAVALVVDEDRWLPLLRRETAYLRSFEHLTEGSMLLDVRRERRYFVQTDGTRLVTEDRYWSLYAEANATAPDGMKLSRTRTFYQRAPEQLPSDAAIHDDIAAMAKETLALREAPVLSPEAAPALLDPSGTGVFFHEAVGHRLEGERQRSKASGQTFTAKLGQQVVPPFISVVDDPTIAEMQGTGLYGHYRFDEEATPAAKAVLIEGGVLKGYLMSRTPVPGFLTSNGHGRSDGKRDPIGRMASLMVSASETVPAARLQEILLEEVRKQGKPFGLVLEDVTSGETNTSRQSYQAFRATPGLAYRIDPTSGEKTLVRGVEIVGTPLAAISRILAAGDQVKVMNGYCGAESGYIPVTEVAPPVVVQSIELQRLSLPSRRPPLLAPPVLLRN